MTDETSTFPSPPVVFLSSASAWSGSAASSCLDTTMSFAVFDVPVVLVLHGAGVLQLLPEQNGDALQLKTLARTWGALSLYGVHEVLVEAESLQDYGHAPDELLCSASRIAQCGNNRTGRDYCGQQGGVHFLMTLHTWNKADSRLANFRLCLAVRREGDALLLIEDGVYVLCKPLSELFADGQVPPDLQVFALADDLAARGISDRIPPLVTVIDYRQFVALTLHHERVVSWI